MENGTTKTTAMIPVRGELIPPATVADVREMAKAAAASGLFAAVKTPEAAFTLMLLAQAEGLHPIQALRRFDIIEGKPALKSDAMLAEFQARGGRVSWLKMDSDTVSAAFMAPGITDPVTVTWTMEDAKRAGLADKPTWKKYPRNMLRARVVSEGVRLAMPGVVVGLYTPEEVVDFDDRPAYTPPAKRLDIQVTPPPAPAPQENDGVPPLASPAQVRALQIALKGLGLEDRAACLDWISKTVGREIGSSKELTAEECARLVETAKAGVMPTDPGDAA